jgi:hypothetical protein
MQEFPERSIGLTGCRDAVTICSEAASWRLVELIEPHRTGR